MSKLAYAVLAFTILARASAPAKRTVVCKTPAIAPSCMTIHGRLQYGNGTPALRLWHIGTTHEFGIFSGLNAETIDPGDNEHPKLPGNLRKIYEGSPNPFEPCIYADFKVCPLEHFIPGHMQAACIASASHIVVAK
jgi:hypothetical protein